MTKLKARATTLYWDADGHRVVAFRDPRGFFAWQRRTRLGKALEAPHAPFASLDDAARDARTGG